MRDDEGVWFCEYCRERPAVLGHPEWGVTIGRLGYVLLACLACSREQFAIRHAFASIFPDRSGFSHDL